MDSDHIFHRHAQVAVIQSHLFMDMHRKAKHLHDSCCSYVCLQGAMTVWESSVSVWLELIMAPPGCAECAAVYMTINVYEFKF